MLHNALAFGRMQKHIVRRNPDLSGQESSHSFRLGRVTYDHPNLVTTIKLRLRCFRPLYVRYRMS